MHAFKFRLFQTKFKFRIKSIPVTVVFSLACKYSDMAALQVILLQIGKGKEDPGNYLYFLILPQIELGKAKMKKYQPDLDICFQ